MRRMNSIFNRIIFSAYGSVLINFGSILLWATTKSLIPNKFWLRVMFAISSATSLIIIGKEYINYVDDHLCSSDHTKCCDDGLNCLLSSTPLKNNSKSGSSRFLDAIEVHDEYSDEIIYQKLPDYDDR